jgi:uncharacterized protein (TIGR03086 family)
VYSSDAVGPSIAVHQNGTPLDVSDGSVAVGAVQRVVWAQSWTPRLLAGESVAEIGTRFDGDLLGESPAAAWDLAQQAAFAAAAGPDLDRRLELVYGELSVWEYIEFQIAELTIHAWDLTRSIGVDDRLDDELAAAVFNRYKSDRLYGGVAPGVGWSAMFKEPVDVAAEADPQSRLLAYVGRDPQLH